MNIEHIEVVKNALGQTKLEILLDIFKNCSGTPPTVPAARYRVSHIPWLDSLDQLASNKTFMQLDDTFKNYRLRVYALPLIDDPRSKELLRLIDVAYKRIRDLYHRHLTEPVPLSLVLESLPAERKDVLEALYYLVDAHGIWSGLSIGFPYDNNPTIAIAESVLRKEDFGSVLSEVYRWQYVDSAERQGAVKSQTLLALGMQDGSPSVDPFAFEHIGMVRNTKDAEAKKDESHSDSDPWYERPIGRIGIGLFIAIVGALFVARLNQWL